MYSADVNEDAGSERIENTVDDLECGWIGAYGFRDPDPDPGSDRTGKRKDADDQQDVPEVTDLSSADVRSKRQGFEELMRKDGDEQRSIIGEADGEADKDGVEAQSKQQDHQGAVALDTLFLSEK